MEPDTTRPSPVAVETLQTGFQDILSDLVEDLIEGAREDVERFLERISHDSVDAALLPVERREAIWAELRGQVATVAELNRVRAVNAAWDRVHAAIEIGHKALRLAVGLPAV